MRLFTCVDHDGHWGVPCASVVLAETEKQARELLDVELVAHGVKPYALEPYTLIEVPMDAARAVVLSDGDY